MSYTYRWLCDDCQGEVVDSTLYFILPSAGSTRFVCPDCAYHYHPEERFTRPFSDAEPKRFLPVQPEV